MKMFHGIVQYDLSVVSGSSPMVGSSRNKSLGLWIRAATISQRILCSRERFLTGTFTNSSSEKIRRQMCPKLFFLPEYGSDSIVVFQMQL